MALKTVRVSTRVSDNLGERIRRLAREEGQSISSIVRQSIELLDVIPRVFRDLIVELSADGDEVALAAVRLQLSSMVERYRSEPSKVTPKQMVHRGEGS